MLLLPNLMLSRDIHYGKPSVINAIEHLELFLKSAKRSEKIVEVITGYGSTGKTHKIKSAVIDYLDELKQKKYIKDFIWGNELDIFCSKYQKFPYKNLIPEIEKQSLNRGKVFIVL